MAISNDTRSKVIVDLARGKSIKYCTDTYGVSYQTVKSWREKVEEALVDEKISEVITIDHPALQMVKLELEKIYSSQMVNKAMKVTEGILGFKKLESEFQEVISDALYRAKQLINNPDTETGDYIEITKTIGSMYANIFSKNNIVINQQNNNSQTNMFDSLQLKA